MVNTTLPNISITLRNFGKNWIYSISMNGKISKMFLFIKGCWRKKWCMTFQQDQIENWMRFVKIFLKQSCYLQLKKYFSKLNERIVENGSCLKNYHLYQPRPRLQLLPMDLTIVETCTNKNNQHSVTIAKGPTIQRKPTRR